MKILIYENRKADPICWDASTPEKEEAALRCLFKLLDDEWECYADIHGHHYDLYMKARKGQFDAIKHLLHLRRGYEYEEYRWGELIDPIQEIAQETTP